jgi:hypothetical protein
VSGQAADSFSPSDLARLVNGKSSMGVALGIASIAMTAVAILYYTGFGVTRLLSFQRIQSQELLIAPLAGFSLIATIGHWGAWLGWSTGLIGIVVLVLSTQTNIIALIIHRARPLKVREHLPILTLACLMFAIAAYPIWQSGTLGPLGANGDQVVYTDIASHLESGGLPGPSALVERLATQQLPAMSGFASSLGFGYLHAFIDLLTRRETHETFAILTAVSLSLTVPSYVALARCLFGAGRLASLLVALFTAVSPALMGVHLQSNGMLAISLSLVPLAFGVSILMGQETRWILLPALLLSATYISHPLAGLALVFCPIILYSALRCAQRKQKIGSQLRTLAMLFGLGMLLNLPGVLQASKLVFHLRDFDFAAGFVALGGLLRGLALYGICHHCFPEGVNPLAFFQASSILLGIGSLAATLYGAWWATGEGRIAFLSLGFLYIPLLAWLSSMSGHTDAFDKTLTFATFPAITGLGLGCERLILATRNSLSQRKRAVVVTFVALLLATNVIHLMALSRWMVSVSTDFPSLLALRNVKNVVSPGERIHVRDARETSLLWIAYLLKDYELALAHCPPAYRSQDCPVRQPAIQSELVLVDKGVFRANSWAVATVYENDRYTLLRKDSRILAHLDFSAGAYPLQKGQQVRLKLLDDTIFVDGKTFPHGTPLQKRLVTLRLGAYLPKGAVIRISSAGGEETIHLSEDQFGIGWPITEQPMEIALTNEGDRQILLAGWLQLVDSQGSGNLPSEEIFERFREEVLPGSRFFIADGWHSLAGGPRRWTKDTSLAIFRNPRQTVALNLEGFLPVQPNGAAPRAVHIFVNGHLMKVLQEAGSFAQTYLVRKEVLDSSEWGDLEISVNKMLNQKASSLGEGAQELGMFISRLEMLNLELPPDGFIDFGTKEARKYLGHGWSVDEVAEEYTFTWADALESDLTFSLPQPADLRVDVRLRPFPDAASMPQELGVQINGKHLQKILLERAQWHIYSFKLPRSLLSPDVNTLRFTYRYAVPATRLSSQSEDPRTLAVAFDFMIVRPE